MPSSDFVISVPVAPALVGALAAWLLAIFIKWVVQTLKP